MELEYQLTKTYWVATLVRMTIVHYPIYLLINKFQRDRVASRFFALVISMPFVALFSWATRLVVDIENIFGSIYLFYFITNIPAALITFALALLIFRKDDFENHGKN